jgi:hypothetical protein
MIPKRPPGMDPKEWRARRAAHYRKINWTLNILMLVAIVALIWRYTRG